MSDAETLRTSRTLPFAPTTVFRAFSDRQTLASWWGPNGFTNEIEVFDFEPGGCWKLVMIGPGGVRFPNESVFVEIEPPSRVVLHHVSAPRFTLTVEITPEGDGTRVEWIQAFENADVAAAIRPLAEPANEQNLDRLSAVLAAHEGAGG